MVSNSTSVKEKICTKCKGTFSLDKFYKDKKGPNGFASCCKKCKNKLSKKWRESLTDEKKAEIKLKDSIRLKKKYHGSEKCREDCKRRVKEYHKTAKFAAYLRHKRKTDAKWIVRTKVGRVFWGAICTGKIVRKCCELCGAKAQAHHPDYNYPLEVQWLCVKHHFEWHKNNNPIYPETQKTPHKVA